ncbi:DUF4215 domain-containing protein [Nannocystis radixulma]|uniref:DUF4215 domain-containing protein n=1 Tax=Nannocystis radixulma TaxID=2995305 RepID=A0ABT5BFY1_9BACT|nr:DUF4215 domain-containing protein [Nannocystis radixulma]MDC0672618.1 DUF4215 domain-containing protein [Nannocystis radixulma]
MVSRLLGCFFALTACAGPEAQHGVSHHASSTTSDSTSSGEASSTSGEGVPSTSSLSGESGGADSSSTGATGVCGDGIVEGLEECDDGNADPEDDCASCLRARWVFATSMLLSPELIGGLANCDACSRP